MNNDSEPPFTPMCNDSRKKAVENVNASLISNRRFPENVFRGGWDEFFFFDPDWLFDSQFVERAKELLELDVGVCVCMCNLDEAGVGGGREKASVFLDRGTSAELYMAHLRGPSAGSGWVYRMDSYGCTSDAGGWCIYCEKNNEIAVMAVRDKAIPDRFQSVVHQFHALPIQLAIRNPPSYGLSPRALSEDWRNRLVQRYALGRKPV